MAMTKTKRRKVARRPDQPGPSIGDFLRRRITNPDPRSHAEFLRDMRAKQAAGWLATPATAALLDRLEGAIR
jgi:hypothetical protein